MSSLKTIHTRIQLKNDTEENWNKATNFIPLLGEIIIYNCDSEHDYQRIKIGNGTDVVNDLPFVNEKTESSVTDEILTLN